MKMLLTLLLSVTTLLTFSQTRTGKIKGSVVDEQKHGIDGATVTLLKAKDAALVKVAVTDKEGAFEFERIANGDYILSITSAGFQKKSSEKITLTSESNTVLVTPLPLAISAKSLENVTVNGKMPLIENKIDRTVVNVDAAPSNAGATAIEVLEKSPGITVDNDGNISLKGKQGVIVMMDGKPTYLSAADLANLLRNMPASALDQIEIMTNPPAKYDAAGNSGIINIKTKKNKAEGMNGSFTTGGTLSLYNRDHTLLTPARSTESLNLNYRKGKINVFGNLNYNYNENKATLDITRKLFEKSGILDVTSIQHSTFNGRNNNYTEKVGLDFYQNKRTTWGVVFNAFELFARPQNLSTQTLYKQDGTVDLFLYSKTFTKLNFSNYSGNMNFKHTFDSGKTELTVDLDYVRYNTPYLSSLITDSYNKPGGTMTGHSELNGDIPGAINIYSLKSDLTKPMKKNVRFDAGFKVSFVENDNEIKYTRLEAGRWVKDNRSNHFIYDENIVAGYISINKQWKKLSAQGGLRAENTNSKGRQVINDSTFTRNYTSLFPTIYLNYQVNKSHMLTLSYGRRINRPNYQDLNPFTWFLDSLTYRQGNPYLLPQYANNFELRHAYKNGITTVLNYTLTEDLISQIFKQDQRRTFLTPDNVAKLQNIGLGITAPYKINKWWNTNTFINVYNNHFQGIYYNQQKNQNDEIDIAYTSFMINLTNSFTFKNGWSGEVSGWYRAKTVEQLSISNEMYFMTLGVQKTALKGKGTFRFNFRDPFHWQQYSAYTKYSDIDVRIKNRWNNRSLSLSFSYRFGKTTVAQARRRATGTNDEESRAGQQQ